MNLRDQSERPVRPEIAIKVDLPGPSNDPAATGNLEAETQIKEHGFQWRLRGNVGQILSELLRDKGQVIKQSPAKLVSFHEINGRQFYLKRYRHDAVMLRSLKFYFKPSQVRQEWELANQLSVKGVPIVEHLAIGERWSISGLQESILVTGAFHGQAIHECRKPNLRAVVDFVSSLHDRGIIQRDLNPGNILFDETTEEMRLVDLHGIEIRSTVPQEDRMDNLAFLRMVMPIPVAPEVKRLSLEKRRLFLEERSKRCLKQNREFAHERHGEMTWHVRIPFKNSPLQKVLDGPDDVLSTKATFLKQGRSCTVGSYHGIVIKRFNLRRLSNLIKNLFRRSRAKASFQKAYHLELAGVSTPRAIAAGDRRIFRALMRSYFVLEEIPAAKHLGEWSGSKRAMIPQLAALLAHMHDCGFSHRDLKESNIVFDDRNKIYILDLEGLRYRRYVSFAQSVWDLKRLDRSVKPLSVFSGRDRLRFMACYRRARGASARKMFDSP